MEKHPTIADAWQQIQRVALDMAADERQRQLDEKGYSFDHDDRHGREELASAAAFFLVPQFIDQTVAVCTGSDEMQLQTLHELIAENAWEGIHRDDYTDAGIRSDVQIDTRIEQLVKGTALALAELERWLRARKLRDRSNATTTVRDLPDTPAPGLTPLEEVLDQAAMFASENSHKVASGNFDYPREWLRFRAQLVAWLAQH